MTAKILTKNGGHVNRLDYRPLTPEERGSEEEIEERRLFDEAIRDRLGEPVKIEDFPEDIQTPTFEYYEDDDDGPANVVPDHDDDDLDTYDQYIQAEVDLAIGGEVKQGKVRERVRREDGTLAGRAHHNPMMDTRSYIVEFPNGEEAEYAANTIAEGMYTMCDTNGNQTLLMKAIVDHKKGPGAVDKNDGFILHRGRKVRRKTTKGWEVCVQWKNKSTSWVPLVDMKNSFPAETAEYAVSRGIEDEPAFAWWVPYVLKKRDRIISKLRTRYHKTTHKFGIELPKDLEHAYRIDKANKNSLWHDAVSLEMKCVRVAFKILDDGEEIPVGYQEIKGHLVFDIKIESLRRKARYCANGNEATTTAAMTYASVVSRESVRIALTIAALNDLEVKAADIQNAYLTAPPKEKVWIRLGPEFGSDQGKRAIVVRALYGLRSAGASFRAHLATCMHGLGYKPCMADPDLWYKAQVRPDDKHEYYSYVLL
mmetsp:Transcript_44940/g.109124  ORF Transcript_44940/g.109124 Transcript_44940/m.109124 type:complete len:481 (-) Transcript_44940:1244-2686(-)